MNKHQYEFNTGKADAIKAPLRPLSSGRYDLSKSIPVLMSLFFLVALSLISIGVYLLTLS